MLNARDILNLQVPGVRITGVKRLGDEMAIEMETDLPPDYAAQLVQVHLCGLNRGFVAITEINRLPEEQPETHAQ